MSVYIGYVSHKQNNDMYDFNINNFLSLIVCQIFLLQGQEMEQKYFFVDFLVNRN